MFVFYLDTVYVTDFLFWLDNKYPHNPTRSWHNWKIYTFYNAPKRMRSAWEKTKNCLNTLREIKKHFNLTFHFPQGKKSTALRHTYFRCSCWGLDIWTGYRNRLFYRWISIVNIFLYWQIKTCKWFLRDRVHWRQDVTILATELNPILTIDQINSPNPNKLIFITSTIFKTTNKFPHFNHGQVPWQLSN